MLLFFEEETHAQAVQRIALAKICQTLRDIGSLINQINVFNDDYPESVERLCRNYFNLFSLFFKQHCQLTVWTMGYVVPYHAKKIYSEFKVGFGILSMQGKEAKHSALKQELRTNTNRSTAKDHSGKWHQIARSNYIRKFYLQYHFPISNYHSHYRQRKALQTDDELNYCDCSRTVSAGEIMCQICIDSGTVMECVFKSNLTQHVTDCLKPVKCEKCTEQFADHLSLDKHVLTTHVKVTKQHVILLPKKLSIDELKSELKKEACLLLEIKSNYKQDWRVH